VRVAHSLGEVGGDLNENFVQIFAPGHRVCLSQEISHLLIVSAVVELFYDVHSSCAELQTHGGGQKLMRRHCNDATSSATGTGTGTGSDGRADSEFEYGDSESVRRRLPLAVGGSGTTSDTQPEAARTTGSASGIHCNLTSRCQRKSRRTY
jgi:hypothetical protein